MKELGVVERRGCVDMSGGGQVRARRSEWLWGGSEVSGRRYME